MKRGRTQDIAGIVNVNLVLFMEYSATQVFTLKSKNILYVKCNINYIRQGSIYCNIVKFWAKYFKLFHMILRKKVQQDNIFIHKYYKVYAVI